MKIVRTRSLQELKHDTTESSQNLSKVCNTEVYNEHGKEEKKILTLLYIQFGKVI